MTNKIYQNQRKTVKTVKIEPFNSLQIKKFGMKEWISDFIREPLSLYLFLNNVFLVILFGVLTLNIFYVHSI